MAGILYLVPTPIGNLGDLSDRIREILAQADFIAAEDTRVSLKLLNHLGLKKPMVCYYRHNTDTAGPQILQRILSGEDCALVTALAVSGLPTGRFTFEGFLATNRKNRRAHLDSLREERRTMIFYEAPHKLLGTLADLTEAFGAERRLALCRELTKLHEEVLRTTLGEALEHYRSNAPRGEFVLVVEGAPEQEEAPALTLEEAVDRVRSLYQGGTSMKDAARQVAGETGFQKKELYRLAVQE